MLQGELDIQRCKLTECNNITLEKSYCSEKCRKTDNKRQKAKKIHQILCDLIYQWMKLSKDDEWLKPPKDGITALELKAKFEEVVKEYLVKLEDGWIYIKDSEKYKKNMTEIPFLGTRNAQNLSGYLRAPQVQDMLHEIGISIEKERGGGNINRYHFLKVS